MAWLFLCAEWLLADKGQVYLEFRNLQCG